MPPRFLIAAALASLVAVPVPAQERAPTAPAAAPEETDSPSEKMASLIVFGNDPCPRSTADEIVVCARLPESERFRVPKRFRGKRTDAPAPDTWANRVAVLESVSRSGLPNSCSPNGSGGQTGCYQQFMRQAREERRQAAAEAAEIP